MIADPRVLSSSSGSHFAMYIYVMSLVPNALTFCSLFMGERTRAPEIVTRASSDTNTSRKR